MRVALVQLTVSDDPEANLPQTLAAVQSAAAQGAEFILTPEVTNCISTSRARQVEVLRREAEDITLAALQDAAKALGVTILIGSLALKTDDADGRFANRSFLIGPDGQIQARYDKMHMFDVTVSDTESYHESKGYRPGAGPSQSEVAGVPVGLTICYDVRFPYLYRHLAQTGAAMITVPAAFAVATGEAHWEVLLRARAIENGCFILAPAQTGTHPASVGASRKTYGHSMIVAPWGEVLLDAGKEPGVYLADLDLTAVTNARGKVPSLTHDRPLVKQDG